MPSSLYASPRGSIKINKQKVITSERLQQLQTWSMLENEDDEDDDKIFH